jgi:hypothetical protein
MSKKRKNMELPEVMEMIKNGSLSKEIAKLLAPHGFPPTNDKDKKFFLQLIDALMSPAPTRTPKKQKPEIYKNPKFIEEIQRAIFKPTGLRDKDFMGFTKDGGQEESAEWDIKGGKAKYPKSKQAKIDRKKNEQRALRLIPTPPKLGVSQAKNIDALGLMLQRTNWLREKEGEEKLAELEFSLKDYAKLRGYDDKQIARGGKFLAELKRDLFTGAYTTYRLDRVIIDGKEYTAHGLPNIYILLEPKNPKDKWRITYNEPYKDYYLNGRQYYPILLKAIQDKGTNSKKGFLYFFFKLVMSYTSTTDFKTQLKVSTLLENIKVSDFTKQRPQEAFKVLAECIYYTASHYKAIKEVRFFESGKCKKVRVITNLEKFKSWDYESFKKEVLEELGLDDIREALISFNRSPQELKELTPVRPAGGEETGQTGQNRTEL